MGELFPNINNTALDLIQSLSIDQYVTKESVLAIKTIPFAHVWVGIGTSLCWIGLFFNITTVMKVAKFWDALEGLVPWIICINFYISCLAFSDIAVSEPIWCVGIMTTYFCLGATKIIICNLVKVKFSIFDDFHLTLPILIATILYPLNWMYLRYDEKLMTQALLALNLFIYFWYIIACINQITAFLGIHCLSIKKKVKDL